MLRTLARRGGAFPPALLTGAFSARQGGAPVAGTSYPAPHKQLAGQVLPDQPHVNRGFAADAAWRGQPSPGPKAVIQAILQERGPLNSDELWENTQSKGFQSKRYMKQMLRQLKADGVLVTLQPGAAQELGWSQITLAKVLTATGKKGKKGSGSGPKFKMVYALKKDIPPAGGSKPSAPEDAAQ